MDSKQRIATAALAVALASVATLPAANAAGKEKCYGVALAGQNDCGNLAGTHSCAGQAKVDNDPGEWKLVAKGTCEDMGGMLKAEAKERYQAQKQLFGYCKVKHQEKEDVLFKYSSYQR